jgi:hypothetical protein
LNLGCSKKIKKFSLLLCYESTKTEENLSLGHDIDTANNWKNKAISRGKENNSLRKVGKFKSKIKANNRTGLTESIFTIAIFRSLFPKMKPKTLTKSQIKRHNTQKKRA